VLRTPIATTGVTGTQCRKKITECQFGLVRRLLCLVIADCCWI